jgi:hypothetical protein
MTPRYECEYRERTSRDTARGEQMRSISGLVIFGVIRNEA